MKKKRIGVAVAVFKRKGGEGLYTKVVDRSTLNKYFQTLLEDQSEEKFIQYYLDDSEWCILSENKIHFKNKGNMIVLSLKDEVKSVSLAIREEFKNGVKNKNDFTLLELTCFDGEVYFLKLEKGNPLWGLYGALSFLLI